MDDKTPVDDFSTQRTPVNETPLCMRCGRELAYIQAGMGVPLREPIACLMARDEAWFFCAGERKGWTRLTYFEGRQVRPVFDKG